MTIKNILLKLVLLAGVLLLSHFVAFPIGEWYEKDHIVSHEFYIGPFAGYSSGFVIGYAFLSISLFAILFGRIKLGVYFALPILVFSLLGIMDDWAQLSFLAFLAGLALAWLILFLKRRQAR